MDSIKKNNILDAFELRKLFNINSYKYLPFNLLFEKKYILKELLFNNQYDSFNLINGLEKEPPFFYNIVEDIYYKIQEIQKKIKEKKNSNKIAIQVIHKPNLKHNELQESSNNSHAGGGKGGHEGAIVYDSPNNRLFKKIETDEKTLLYKVNTQHEVNGKLKILKNKLLSIDKELFIYLLLKTLKDINNDNIELKDNNYNIELKDINNDNMKLELLIKISKLLFPDDYELSIGIDNINNNSYYSIPNLRKNKNATLYDFKIGFFTVDLSEKKSDIQTLYNIKHNQNGGNNFLKKLLPPFIRRNYKLKEDSQPLINYNNVTQNEQIGRQPSFNIYDALKHKKYSKKLLSGTNYLVDTNSTSNQYGFRCEGIDTPSNNTQVINKLLRENFYRYSNLTNQKTQKSRNTNSRNTNKNIQRINSNKNNLNEIKLKNHDYWKINHSNYKNKFFSILGNIIKNLTEINKSKTDIEYNKLKILLHHYLFLNLYNLNNDVLFNFVNPNISDILRVILKKKIKDAKNNKNKFPLYFLNPFIIFEKIGEKMNENQKADFKKKLNEFIKILFVNQYEAYKNKETKYVIAFIGSSILLEDNDFNITLIDFGHPVIINTAYLHNNTYEYFRILKSIFINFIYGGLSFYFMLYIYLFNDFNDEKFKTVVKYLYECHIIVQTGNYYYPNKDSIPSIGNTIKKKENNNFSFEKYQGAYKDYLNTDINNIEVTEKHNAAVKEYNILLNSL